MFDCQTATVLECEAEIIRLEGEVQSIRANELQIHQAAEMKRALIPIIAMANDQVMTPGQGTDLLKWAANLPTAAKEALKHFLEGK